MPRLPMHPASGSGIVTPFTKAIRFARYGCANRPFFHVVVIDVKKQRNAEPVEQIGTFDPIPNIYNEKLASFNFDRLQYWLTKDVQVSKPVAILLGLAGYFPVHPKSYMRAWRNRRRENEERAVKEQAAES
ncbi:probable 28S ribosomal protein S16, mitochondrial [Pseudomyrmex gracilis]|uniref:probable 28S ribosomal protein S16, mitochondrial n=1 Tax=Pseudomyrmex gracilis TaxID=219809 RepID=UPI00099590B2|nr:probable 28S ribosomal protein S16, mitochondrial [Pseudomyrmex gracilis]